MPAPRRQWLGAIIIVVGMFGFACGVIIAKHLFEAGTDPLTLLTVRSIGMSAVLALVLWALRQPIRLPRRQRWSTVGLGGLFAIQSWCYFSGIERIPVSIAALVEYTYPFQVAVVAHFLGRESLTPSNAPSVLTG